MFPVLGAARRRTPGSPTHVPWAVLAPHEAWALRNHSQTLERLAERGGLSLCEMCAVIEERRWRKMDDAEALARVLAEVESVSARRTAKGEG
jgi:hypothetical protein